MLWRRIRDDSKGVFSGVYLREIVGIRIMEILKELWNKKGQWIGTVDMFLVCSFMMQYMAIRCLSYGGVHL